MKVLTLVLAAVAIFLVNAVAAMFLWNWLSPAVFNGPEVTFAEACGILLLVGCITHRPTYTKSN
jgi:hypothetical protein